jgi:hypothetical protein
LDSLPASIIQIDAVIGQRMSVRLRGSVENAKAADALPTPDTTEASNVGGELEVGGCS